MHSRLFSQKGAQAPLIELPEHCKNSSNQEYRQAMEDLRGDINILIQEKHQILSKIVLDTALAVSDTETINSDNIIPPSLFGTSRGISPSSRIDLTDSSRSNLLKRRISILKQAFIDSKADNFTEVIFKARKADRLLNSPNNRTPQPLTPGFRK